MTRLLIGLSALSLFAAVSAASFKASRPEIPPHELRGVRIEPAIVSPDKDGNIDLVVYTEAVRREKCTATVFRMIANEASEIVFFAMAPAAALPPSGKLMEVPVHVRIPATRLPDGTYRYQNIVTNKDCPGSREAFISPSDGATFKVVRDQ